MLDSIAASSLWEPTPDMEPVNLLAQQGPTGQGTFQTWFIPYARRRKLNKEEQMVHAALLGEQLIVWEIWQYALNIGVPAQTAPGVGSNPPAIQASGSAPNPKMRDRINAVSDASTWIIVKSGVTQDFIGTLWVLVTQFAPGPTP